MAATGVTDGLRATGAEIRGWIRCGWPLVRRYPGPVAVSVALVWLCRDWVPALVWVGVPVVVVALRAWAVVRPGSFGRVAHPLVCLWKRLWLRWHWRGLAETCGLSMIDPRALARIRSGRYRGEFSRPAVPKVRRSHAEWPRVRLVVRPLMGQTVEDFGGAAERLRIATAATHLRVEPHGVNEVSLTFTVGDELATPFVFAAPTSDSPLQVERVLMGRLEDGSPWFLPVGPHTLVAGCSGAGKGSLFWSFAFGLAPAVRAGVVRLHGIDLKGGMEILMGRGLFTMHATRAADAVVMLERLVGEMQDRTHRYAGRVRSHVPTVDEPLHVVMVDELAALTAYCPERDLQRRAELAINLLCSQGRAPGFVVFACLQDPRKEIIPSRGLFTQMVGLRLKDLSETTMVLGEVAVTSGAHCHRITRGTPGMGYVVPEDGGHPVRVRAGYVPDDAIRDLSHRFATPMQIPVAAIVPDQAERTALPRRTRGAA
jgi:DNA segregation ATPase FtsK/SpoIIIE, S-DNA-T family